MAKIIPELKRWTDEEIALLLGWSESKEHPYWWTIERKDVGDVIRGTLPPVTSSIDAIVDELNRGGFCYELYYSHKKSAGQKGKALVWKASYNPKIPVKFEIGNEAMALCQAFANLMTTLRKYDPKYKDKQ